MRYNEILNVTCHIHDVCARTLNRQPFVLLNSSSASTSTSTLPQYHRFPDKSVAQCLTYNTVCAALARNVLIDECWILYNNNRLGEDRESLTRFWYDTVQYYNMVGVYATIASMEVIVLTEIVHFHFRMKRFRVEYWWRCSETGSIVVHLLR